MRLLVVVIISLITGISTAPPSFAEDDPVVPVVVGNATGGGWLAGTEGGRPPTPAEAEVLAAKQRIWDAYDGLVTGRLTREEYADVLSRHSAAAHLGPDGDASARTALRPPPCGEIDDPCPDAKLAVPHVGQVTSYYCGPASGVMIARYKGKRRSAHTGAALAQRKMANVAHMHTEETQSTPYWSGKFTRGLNRWLYGSDSDRWRYAQVNTPSVRRFKRALRFNINTWMPLGVSTVELRSEERTYNGHQYAESGAIGHWIVARGYRSFGRRTLFLDPATTVWRETRPRFSRSTRQMVRAYVDYNGISVT